MKTYLVIDLDIKDLEGFMEYVSRIPELIKKYSGRYIVEGAEPLVVQAKGQPPERTVVLEFPERKLAEAFLEERSKSDLHAIWSRTTDSRILMVNAAP